MPRSVAHDIAFGRSLTFAAWAAADDGCSQHSSPRTQTGQLAPSPASQQTLMQAPRQTLASGEGVDNGFAEQSDRFELQPEQAPSPLQEPGILLLPQQPLPCAEVVQNGCTQGSHVRAHAPELVPTPAPEHDSLQPPGHLSCQAAGVDGDGLAWSPAEICTSSGQEVVACAAHNAASSCSPSTVAWADTPAAACAAACAEHTPVHRAGSVYDEAEFADKACHQEALSAGEAQSQQGKSNGAGSDGQSSEGQPTSGLQDQHSTGVSAASPSHPLHSSNMSDGAQTPCGSPPAAKQVFREAVYCCSPETPCAAWDGSAGAAFAAWQRVTVMLWQRRLHAAAPVLRRNRIR